MRSHSLKRAIDLVGSSLLLVTALVPMAIIALVIRARMGSPVLHAALRPGLYGRPFVMYKFRTMTNQRNHRGDLLSDAQRITSLGRALRSSSLDELPEFFNVLRGEMSLVGPRPLRMEYLNRYSTHQARRHEVKPGITGWAQIKGRNALTWEERFDLDVWYVDHWSIGLDISILGQTLLTVVRREGVSALDHATMPEFMGSGPKG